MSRFFTPPWIWFFLGLLVSICEFFLRKTITKKYRFVILMVGVSAVLEF